MRLPFFPRANDHRAAQARQYPLRVRRDAYRQANEIIQRLAGHRRPLVLMGDFNCGFGTKDQTLSVLARELNLQSHEPEATDMASFPSRNKRFDWIMISTEFAFLAHRTLSDVLSDHRAVVATLGLARPQATGSARFAAVGY